MKKNKTVNRLLAFFLVTCLLIGINTGNQHMLEYKDTYKDYSCIASTSVPHGLHYSYLENDTQRFLYDMMYKVGTLSNMGGDNEVIFYYIGEAESRGYYYKASNGKDIEFASNALKYDNPDKIGYALCEFVYSYKKNTSGKFDVYLGAKPRSFSYDFLSMNAQMKNAIDNIISTAKEKNLIDLSSEESTVMSLFKLALYMHPVEPDYNNYYANAYDYDWWGIVYDWDALRNPQNEYPHTAYAALVDKLAVCDGISTAYMYALKELGINDCLCVEGIYGTPHAWNIVKIGGEWYAIDVTNMVIGGGEFANNEINKVRETDSFGYNMPTANGSKYIGTEIGEKYIAKRGEQYGFRQGSPSQENGNGSTSEDPSNSSSGSTTTTETPSNNGSEGNSSSKSESSSSNAGSTTESSSNSGNTNSNSSSSASNTGNNNNNSDSGNSASQPSTPSSGNGSSPSTDAGTSTSTPSSNENDNVSSNAANNASNNATTQTSSNEEVKPSSSGTTQQTDTKKDDKTKETTTKKDTKTAKIIPATPKNVSTKVSKKTVTVKWKKQTKNTTGYEIQYSTDKKFKKSVKTVSAKKTATKTTIKKLKAKKTYYVRIRTKCKNGSKTTYSKWSKVMKVKIK